MIWGPRLAADPFLWAEIGEADGQKFRHQTRDIIFASWCRLSRRLAAVLKRKLGARRRRNFVLAPSILIPSHPPRKNRFSLLVVAFVLVGCGLMLAAPPTGENAYCAKGDVPQFGDRDGPAELPKACFYTGMDGTPSPGRQIRVPARANLAAEVEAAKCGDTLLLPAGASFEVRILPRKNCDDRHYITIRTDTPDSKLPAEGTRISPAWGGIARLPGRPPYAQPAGGPAKLLATLIVRRPSGAVPGDHMRFIGIEWTSAPGVNTGRLVSAEGSDHVVFDRNWVHPAEGAEVGKGIVMIQGARVIAVINSYINGLNCVARAGKCTDASAVGGGNGDGPTGTYKIFNNFLEASGQDVFFGGAAASVNPTDIEIRRNHLFRPMTWREGEPGYTPSPSGNPYIVKNIFELKNAQRVLFEANLLENSWGGFSQTGFAILLTPKNPADKCPKCQVTDITIRFCRIRNVAAVFQVANVLSKTGEHSADGGRYSIHDVVVDSVRDGDYKGPGVFLQILSRDPPVHDVSIDHVTAFVPGPLMGILNKGEKINNFALTHGVFEVGEQRPALASAGGGRENCAGRTQQQGAEAVLKECFSNYKFDKNLIVSGRGRWPAGTLVASSPESAGIRDLKNGVGRDPRLCREKTAGCGKVSPGAGAAPGARDLGADVDAVEAAIQGVE
jgi:hypothetical protein